MSLSSTAFVAYLTAAGTMSLLPSVWRPSSAFSRGLSRCSGDVTSSASHLCRPCPRACNSQLSLTASSDAGRCWSVSGWTTAAVSRRSLDMMAGVSTGKIKYNRFKLEFLSRTRHQPKGKSATLDGCGWR